MKPCHVLSLLIVVCGLFQAVHSVDEKNAKETCIKAAKLSADDTKRITTNVRISQGNQPVSEALKCFLFCYYKAVGLIGIDGKTDYVAIVNYLEKTTGIKDKSKLTTSMANCDAVHGVNNCDKVYQFEHCVFGKLGI